VSDIDEDMNSRPACKKIGEEMFGQELYEIIPIKGGIMNN
jgi:hypothetical protein